MGATGETSEGANEELRLRKALESLSPLQEAHRPRLQQQLEVLTIKGTAVAPVEPTPDVSPLAWDNRDPLSGLEREYVGRVVQRFRPVAGIYADLSIGGRAPAGVRRIRPEAVEFVALHHDVYTSLSHSFEAASTSSFVVETLGDLIRIVDEHRRVALIGDPGCGKTTTLQMLAYSYARRTQEAGYGLIPFFVDLGGLGGRDIDEYLQEQVSGLIVEAVPMARRFYILDGLNEIAVSDSERVAAWLHDRNDTQVIVACRKLDYLERELPLRRIDVRSLDVRQIHALIGRIFEDRERDRLFWSLAGRDAAAAWRWYRGNVPRPSFDDFWYGDIGRSYPYEMEKYTLYNVQGSVRDRGSLPGVLDVVSNPFLLFAAILIFMNNNEPPHNRSGLFSQLAALMLRRSGLLALPSSRPDDGENDLSSLPAQWLSYLAFRMIQSGQGTGVEKAWAVSELTQRYGDQNFEVVIGKLVSASLLDLYSANPVLLKFRHQLMQEFFACLALIDEMRTGRSAGQLLKTENWWDPTPWDEAVVLAAAVLGDASELVAWLTSVNPSLAFRCVNEPGVFTSDDVYGALLDPPTTARMCPNARAEWGRRIAEAGDGRRGVGLQADGTPDILWVTVPSGTMEMGGQGELATLGIAGSLVEVTIPYKYMIAKYPITCTQFGAFVSDGYSDPKYWSSIGWQWKHDQAVPRLWTDSVLHVSNHPVVGISWFEAAAFARWLDERLHALDWKPDNPELIDYQVSLPLEAEWELAARYPDGRSFPWGWSYIPGHANIDETYLGELCGPYAQRRTTAVGIYEQGRSELGIYDLCGNVWEWCISKWDVVYRFPETVLPVSLDHRGVRGGSWYNSVAFARCEAHDCQDADLGVNDVGMRLVLRPRGLVSDIGSET